jgi:hypothetical protein
MPDPRRYALALGLLCACNGLLGLDFDAVERPAAPDEDAMPEDGGASVEAASAADAGARPDASSSPDAPEGYDPAWTRWQVSGAFPAANTTARDGMVEDSETGLVWAQAPLPTAVTFPDAEAACAAHTLGGFTDWRVPTRIELLSLVAYDFAPPITADLELPLGEGWSSSRSAGDATRAWYVFFSSGASNTRVTSDALRVRCVRAGKRTPSGPAYRFATGFGTVFDKVTNLTWQAGSTGAGSRAQATQHCAMLSINGTSGFRVPEIHELHSIVDERRAGPALDPAFGEGAITWSATSKKNDAGYGWTIDFYDGHTLAYDATKTAAFRCVK